MKTKKRILAYVSWRHHQHGHTQQWLIVLATSVLMWVADSLGVLAATTPFHDHMEDVRWVWRDRTLNFGVLAIITVVVIVGLVWMGQVQRRHHWL